MLPFPRFLAVCGLVLEIRVESVGGALPAIVLGVEKGSAPNKASNLWLAVSRKGMCPQHCPQSPSAVPLQGCQ